MTSTEEQHATAIKAALTAQQAAPYDLDDLKALTSPPSQYVEVTVSRRYGGEERATGSTGRIGWRISTRAVATTISNAREMRKRAVTALLYARLTVDGDKTTPIQFEGEEPIGDDDGWYSGLSTWTYAI